MTFISEIFRKIQYGGQSKMAAKMLKSCRIQSNILSDEVLALYYRKVEIYLNSQSERAMKLLYYNKKLIFNKSADFHTHSLL